MLIPSVRQQPKKSKLILPGSPLFTIENKVPKRTDWLSKRDAVMIPDKGFTKQLKTLRKTFEVVWDWGSSKWKIWDFPEEGEPYHVLTVETKGKTYRELGADVLLQLQSIMPERIGYKELDAYLDETDAQIRRRRARDFANKIRSITKDTFNYARGVLSLQVPRCFRVENATKTEESICS